MFQNIFNPVFDAAKEISSSFNGQQKKEEQQQLKALEFVQELISSLKTSLSMDEYDELSLLSPDALVAQAEAMMETQDSFLKQGRPVQVDIGYHYTKEQNLESVKQNGLLNRTERQTNCIRPSNFNGAKYGEGIYTGNDPRSHTRYGPIGIVVVRLKGITKHLNKYDYHYNSKVMSYEDNNNCIIKGEEDIVILQHSSQCMTLLQYSTEDFAHKIASSKMLKAAQTVIDKYFNDTPMIVEKFHTKVASMGTTIGASVTELKKEVLDRRNSLVERLSKIELSDIPKNIQVASKQITNSIPTINSKRRNSYDIYKQLVETFSSEKERMILLSNGVIDCCRLMNSFLCHCVKMNNQYDQESNKELLQGCRDVCQGFSNMFNTYKDLLPYEIIQHLENLDEMLSRYDCNNNSMMIVWSCQRPILSILQHIHDERKKYNETIKKDFLKKVELLREEKNKLISTISFHSFHQCDQWIEVTFRPSSDHSTSYPILVQNSKHTRCEIRIGKPALNWNFVEARWTTDIDGCDNYVYHHMIRNEHVRIQPNHNNWYHVVLIYNHSMKTITLYVNGKPTHKRLNENDDNKKNPRELKMDNCRLPNSQAFTQEEHEFSSTLPSFPIEYSSMDRYVNNLFEQRKYNRLTKTAW